MRARLVDRDLWIQPEFRRATPFARELWLFLLTHWADDEGRFYALPRDILDAYPPNSNATEDGIEEALRYWESVGWLKRYSNKQFGFICGWHTFQSISFADTSKIPPPSRKIALIHSWDDLRILREIWCKHFRRDGRVRNDILVRFFLNKGTEAHKLAIKALVYGKMPDDVAHYVADNVPDYQEDDVNDIVAHNVPHNKKRREEKRREYNIEEKRREEKNPPLLISPPYQRHNVADDVADDVDASNDAMEACNEPLVGELVVYLRPVMSPPEAQRYALDILRMLRLPNAGLTEKEVLEAIAAGNGPRAGRESTLPLGPQSYIERLLREKRGREAAQRILRQRGQFDWEKFKREGQNGSTE